ncbi:MAG: hypothetical protein C0415_02240 [Thermodesulfovibrio sp.]|nr:hypothetical protein [Thermodesulfovibrio sp.]
MMAKVLFKFKEAVLKEIPLNKDVFTIGRKPDADIHIDNPVVSSFHAKIFKDGTWFTIEDMNSLNGTFVNGKKIQKCPLNNGDEILIGKHTIKFISEEVAPPLAPTVSMQTHSMDETMVIDQRVQQAMLGKSMEGRVSEEKEVLGGLIVIEGSTDKKEYELTERIITIGKDDDAGIKLKGFFAPKVAALINRRKGGYFITPSGKGKTPQINGKEIEERHELKDGDILEVGGVKMQFYIKE